MKDILIVLDASGSMAQNGRLDIAKAVATQIVTGLTQSDYVNIIIVRNPHARRGPGRRVWVPVS